MAIAAKVNSLAFGTILALLKTGSDRSSGDQIYRVIDQVHQEK
jgi:hypothetical protein